MVGPEGMQLTLRAILAHVDSGRSLENPVHMP